VFDFLLATFSLCNILMSELVDGIRIYAMQAPLVKKNHSFYVSIYLSF
jgi:hypothetical protein